MENKNDILDDFLGRISCQDLLKVDGEDDFIDHVMENIPDISAEKMPKIRGWVVVMRAVSSIAAVFFVALFFSLGADSELTDYPSVSSASCGKEAVANLIPCADDNSSALEFYDCYHKHKLERRSRRISFNH